MFFVCACHKNLPRNHIFSPTPTLHIYIMECIWFSQHIKFCKYYSGFRNPRVSLIKIKMIINMIILLCLYSSEGGGGDLCILHTWKNSKFVSSCSRQIMPYQIDSPHNKISLRDCVKILHRIQPVSCGDERKP